jgi:hypothetical protein
MASQTTLRTNLTVTCKPDTRMPSSNQALRTTRHAGRAELCRRQSVYPSHVRTDVGFPPRAVLEAGCLPIQLVHHPDSLQSSLPCDDQLLAGFAGNVATTENQLDVANNHGLRTAHGVPHSNQHEQSSSKPSSSGLGSRVGATSFASTLLVLA